MARHKNDIEQTNTKRSKEEVDDFYDDESGLDELGEDSDIETATNNDLTARKRLEAYLEEKRLRKELGDDLFDF